MPCRCRCHYLDGVEFNDQLHCVHLYPCVECVSIWQPTPLARLPWGSSVWSLGCVPWHRIAGSWVWTCLILLAIARLFSNVALQVYTAVAVYDSTHRLPTLWILDDFLPFNFENQISSTRCLSTVLIYRFLVPSETRQFFLSYFC